jgi:hydroxyethylthiazole kinase
MEEITAKEVTKQAAAIVDLVRKSNPLIDCITNYVTVNDCANILLSFGASPAMCDAQDIAADFAGLSAALYLNFGTYLKEQQDSALVASIAAKSKGIPLIIDPVGCGTMSRRIDQIDLIALHGHISIIKGNMGEIMALAGTTGASKGVDSLDAVEGIEDAAQKVARRYKCVVAATGAVDVVTDGERVIRISNGVDTLKKVTGAGCMVGALCGACATVAKDHGGAFAATVAAIAVMGIAGEIAAQVSRSPGSFRVALMDAVYGITGETILQKGRIA